MQSHGMPLGVLAPVGPARVLLIEIDTAIRHSLETEFATELDLEYAASAFEAGSMAVNLRPHCVVIDSRKDPEALKPVALGLRRLMAKDIVLVGIIPESSTDPELLQTLDETFRPPVDAALVAARIHHLARRMSLKVR